MGKRLAVRGITHVGLRVSDVARSRSFYADTLGFTVLKEGEGFCIVDAGGTGVGLLGPTSRAEDRFDPFRVGVDHLALTVVSVTDLEEIRDQLNASSVPNNGIERDSVLGGSYISFYDPDGIAWEAYHHPSWGGS